MQNNAKGQVISLAEGGDLSGQPLTSEVVGINHIPITLTSLSTGQVLTYNGSNWINTPPPNFFIDGLTVKNITVYSASTYTILSTDVIVVLSPHLPAFAASDVTMPSSSPVGRILLLCAQTGSAMNLHWPAGTSLNGNNAITTINSLALICYDGTHWGAIGRYP